MDYVYLAEVQLAEILVQEGDKQCTVNMLGNVYYGLKDLFLTLLCQRMILFDPKEKKRCFPQ